MLTRDFSVVGHLCCYSVWTCIYDSWHVACPMLSMLQASPLQIGRGKKKLNSFYHIAPWVPFLGLIIQNTRWLQEPLNKNTFPTVLVKMHLKYWLEGRVYQMRSGSNMFSFLCNMTHQLVWLLIFSVCDMKNIFVSNKHILIVHEPHSCSPDPPPPPHRSL